MNLTLATLPALGAPLDGGIFAGIVTQPDGTHVAVVLLPDRAEDLTWKKATAWAKKLSGVLPSRPVAALLFANIKSHLIPSWHWTSDELDASCAWLCNFNYDSPFSIHKSYEARAVAIRRLKLER